MNSEIPHQLVDELSLANELSLTQFWEILRRYGFREGSKSRSETNDLFLDVKPIEGHRFTSKEDAVKAVDILRILKSRNLFHPSLQVFIVLDEATYQLAFIQKALLNVADPNFYELDDRDPITANLNDLEVGEILSSLYVRDHNNQLNHLARWYRRIGTLEAHNPDISFMRLINPVELSYTKNWGRDPETGILYPVDMECIEFSQEKIRMWEEDHTL